MQTTLRPNHTRPPLRCTPLHLVNVPIAVYRALGRGGQVGDALAAGVLGARADLADFRGSAGLREGKVAGIEVFSLLDIVNIIVVCGSLKSGLSDE